MKKTLLFFIAAFMVFSVSGQQPGLHHRMRDLHKTQPEELQQKLSEIRETFKRLHLAPAERHSLKSQKGIKHQLDSIIFTTLDENTLDFVDEMKSEFEYDGEGRMTVEREYKWDDTFDEWVPFLKNELTWDNDGNITEIINFSWGGPDEGWYEEDKEVYTYDNDGNPTEYIFYLWDYDDEDWVPEERYLLTYDGDGNLLQEIFYYAEFDTDPVEWTEEQMWEYEYENGQLVSITAYFLEDDDWEPEEMTQFFYDNDGVLDYMTRSEYDAVTGEFEVFQHIDYEYNPEGEVARTTYSRYDDDEVKEPVVKSEFEYDGNLNIIMEATYMYNDGIGDWEKSTMNEYVYDTDVSIEEIAVPYYLTYWLDVKNMLLETKYFRADMDDEWYLKDHGFFYYSDYDPDDDPDPDPDPEEYTLAITIEGDGTVQVNGEDYTEAITFETGTEITLTAIPGDDYEFVEWKGDHASDETEVTITIEDDLDITAVFEVVSSAIRIEQAELTIYPNPFRDVVTVTNLSSVSTVTIANMLGQTVMEFDTGGSDNMTFSTGDLNDGIYLFIFTTRSGDRIVKRMIKH